MRRKPVLRRGVCGVIRSSQGLILLGERRKDKGQWQLPQGGIEKGESPMQALVREMAEEVGDFKIRVLNDSKKFIPYLWPKGVARKGRFDGQEHLYFLIDGRDVDVDQLTATEEFGDFDWFSVEQVLGRIVEWRREAYEEAFRLLELRGG